MGIKPNFIYGLSKLKLHYFQFSVYDMERKVKERKERKTFIIFISYDESPIHFFFITNESGTLQKARFIIQDSVCITDQWDFILLFWFLNLRLFLPVLRDVLDVDQHGTGGRSLCCLLWSSSALTKIDRYKAKKRFNQLMIDLYVDENQSYLWYM